MKTNLLDINGKKLREITLPEFFSQPVREDIIFKILEAKKIKQPYGPSPVAGNQYSASGKLKHHRKVWKSQYGRGMSRIPRKTMSRRGSQFNWVGATVPNTRGGRRAHPPKVLSMIGLKRINKKELKLALISALSATANEKYISKRYASIANEKMDKFPIVVESKLTTLKTKNLIESLKKLFPENLFHLILQKKNRGLLLVIGNEEKLKTTAFDVKTVKKLSIKDLAVGGPGRLTLYTENALKDLENKILENKK